AVVHLLLAEESGGTPATVCPSLCRLRLNATRAIRHGPGPHPTPPALECGHHHRRSQAMTIRIVRLGSPRRPDEGPRIGTVRRPPRGVPRERFGPDDWYDTWFPLLAPSADTIQLAQAAKTPADWARFVRTYRREMGSPE